MADLPLQWRLLEDGIEDPFLQFALEETLLRRVAEGRSRPTLRLRRSVPSIWIGVFQDPREDVDLGFCRERGLPVVRRPNPGGAVYQDRGSFCMTATFPKQPTFEALGVHHTRDLYRVMGDLVVGLCQGLGIEAAAAPVNDVLVGGRKIYGSAQIEMGDAVAHSGTFLVDVDIDVMASALRPSKLKYADKGFSGVRERVLNLAEAAGRPLQVREVMDLFVEALRRRLPVALTPGELTEEEVLEAARLHQEKYLTEEWTFPHRRPAATTLATKAPSGVVVLDLATDGLRIESLAVRGDFLLDRREDLAAFAQQAQGMTLAEASGLLERGPLPEDLKLALIHLLEESLQGSVPLEVEIP